MFDLYLDVEPFNLDVETWFKTFMRKLYAEPLCEAFIRNLRDEPFCETLCGTFLWSLGTFISGIWELVRVEPFIYMEPWETWTFMWNRGTFKSGTCTFMWNRGTFKSETCTYRCMWNLGEPAPLWELLRVEPSCVTLANLVPGFGRLPQTTPKLYWKNPKLFKLWGKGWKNRCR